MFDTYISVAILTIRLYCFNYYWKLQIQTNASCVTLAGIILHFLFNRQQPLADELLMPIDIMMNVDGRVISGWEEIEVQEIFLFRHLHLLQCHRLHLLLQGELIIYSWWINFLSNCVVGCIHYCWTSVHVCVYVKT